MVKMPVAEPQYRFCFSVQLNVAFSRERKSSELLRLPSPEHSGRNALIIHPKSVNAVNSVLEEAVSLVTEIWEYCITVVRASEMQQLFSIQILITQSMGLQIYYCIANIQFFVQSSLEWNWFPLSLNIFCYWGLCNIWWGGYHNRATNFHFTKFPEFVQREICPKATIYSFKKNHLTSKIIQEMEFQYLFSLNKYHVILKCKFA